MNHKNHKTNSNFKDKNNPSLVFCFSSQLQVYQSSIPLCCNACPPPEGHVIVPHSGCCFFLVDCCAACSDVSVVSLSKFQGDHIFGSVCHIFCRNPLILGDVMPCGPHCMAYVGGIFFSNMGWGWSELFPDHCGRAECSYQTSWSRSWRSTQQYSRGPTLTVLLVLPKNLCFSSAFFAVGLCIVSLLPSSHVLLFCLILPVC